MESEDMMKGISVEKMTFAIISLHNINLNVCSPLSPFSTSAFCQDAKSKFEVVGAVCLFDVIFQLDWKLAGHLLLPPPNSSI